MSCPLAVHKNDDKRVFWGDEYIALTQDTGISVKIKLGINNEKGKIAYINHGQALVKAYAPFDSTLKYPDFGVSAETFANGHFVEFETLSPLTELKRGEALTHTEEWTLTDNVSIEEKSNDALKEIGEKLFN